MVRLQMVVAVVVLAACGSNAEARGRRMFHQQNYGYHNNATVQSVPVVSQTVMAQPTSQSITVVPATGSMPSTTAVMQTSGTVTNSGNVVIPANSSVSVANPAVPTPGTAAAGSAQWKAEQSARMGSVAHIGGGFGGGSYEGNGFGATPQQAIQGACFWGQRTPIEIGVARGANGYYATIFYR